MNYVPSKYWLKTNLFLVTVQVIAIYPTIKFFFDLLVIAKLSATFLIPNVIYLLN